MTRPRLVALHATLFVVAAAQWASAADLSRYRTYRLGDTVAAVASASNTDPRDVTTVHERPALIQELQWRPPYTNSAERPDPVNAIYFRFAGDKLYQITVMYDRERTTGLTDEDMVNALAAVYGAPVRGAEGNRGAKTADLATNTTVLARWTDDAGRLTLSRDVEWHRYQLVLESQPLAAEAEASIAESVRLDLLAKPARDLDLQRQAAIAAEQVRTANRAAFHP